MSTKYTLVPRCQNITEDKVGLWQIEGGELLLNKIAVGTYSVVRRTSCGTPRRGAMVWMTLLFTRGKAGVGNMTLHGARESARETGSVSAATAGYFANINHQFERVGNILVIV